MASVSSVFAESVRSTLPVVEAFDEMHGPFAVRIAFDAEPSDWHVAGLWDWMVRPFEQDAGPFEGTSDLPRSMLQEGEGAPLVSHGRLPNTQDEGSVVLFCRDNDNGGRLCIAAHWEDGDLPPAVPDLEIEIAECGLAVRWTARADERMFVSNALAAFCILFCHEMYELQD